MSKEHITVNGLRYVVVERHVMNFTERLEMRRTVSSAWLQHPRPSLRQRIRLTLVTARYLLKPTAESCTYRYDPEAL